MDSFDSDDFQTDNDSADPDFEPSSAIDSTSNSVINETDQSTTDENIDIVIESGIIDETVLHDLSLQAVSKRKLNSSKTWNYFGNLLYKTVLISKVSKRVYCRKCFDALSLKRYLFLPQPYYVCGIHCCTISAIRNSPV